MIITFWIDLIQYNTISRRVEQAFQGIIELYFQSTYPYFSHIIIYYFIVSLTVDVSLAIFSCVWGCVLVQLLLCLCG